jgi:hypothetical protein
MVRTPQAPDAQTLPSSPIVRIRRALPTLRRVCKSIDRSMMSRFVGSAGAGRLDGSGGAATAAFSARRCRAGSSSTHGAMSATQGGFVPVGWVVTPEMPLPRDIPKPLGFAGTPQAGQYQRFSHGYFARADGHK